MASPIRDGITRPRLTTDSGSPRSLTLENGGAQVNVSGAALDRNLDTFSRNGGAQLQVGGVHAAATNSAGVLHAQPMNGGNFASGPTPVSWADPAARSTPAQAQGRLEGFDHNKLNDPNHNTPKYIMARIFQNYPNTPEGLRQAMAEIQRHFPEARIVGNKGDVIDFGSHTDPEGRPLGKIDVIRAAGGPNGGEAWQWLPVGESGAGGAGSGGGPSASGSAGGGGSGGLPSGLTMDDLLAFLQSPEGRRLLESVLQGGGGAAAFSAGQMRGPVRA